MVRKLALTKNQLSQIKRKLAERKRSLGQSRRAYEEEARELTGEATGEIGHVKTHPADLGGLESNRRVSLDILEHFEGELREVLAAEERMDSGTYGSCASCGYAIPVARLLAMPETTHCSRCQRSLESGLTLVSAQQPV